MPKLSQRTIKKCKYCKFVTRDYNIRTHLAEQHNIGALKRRRKGTTGNIKSHHVSIVSQIAHTIQKGTTRTKWIGMHDDRHCENEISEIKFV